MANDIKFGFGMCPASPTRVGYVPVPAFVLTPKSTFTITIPSIGVKSIITNDNANSRDSNVDRIVINLATRTRATAVQWIEHWEAEQVSFCQAFLRV